MNRCSVTFQQRNNNHNVSLFCLSHLTDNYGLHQYRNCTIQSKFFCRKLSYALLLIKVLLDLWTVHKVSFSLSRPCFTHHQLCITVIVIAGHIKLCDTFGTNMEIHYLKIVWGHWVLWVWTLVFWLRVTVIISHFPSLKTKQALPLLYTGMCMLYMYTHIHFRHWFMMVVWLSLVCPIVWLYQFTCRLRVVDYFGHHRLS